MAKQFLRVHDASFASPSLAAGKYTSYNYRDLLELYEQVRVAERQYFYSNIRALAGKPVVLKDHLSHYSLSTVWKMLSRDEYFSEGNAVLNMDELHEMVDEWFLLSGVLNIGDWIPWLSPFDLQGYVKKMKALNKKMDKFYDCVIDDHLARRVEKDEVAPMDFVDTL
ncbi:hypothetical protein SASPL_150338 [Salvia splendens]|uniref:Uncharacterized protein n=1 Tax=Salvia splendens TaxID=180675 RepID=A0A8X8Z1N8_SALSN|nr:hypothetical protein SASPL_150338 [Salvia splendens]